MLDRLTAFLTVLIGGYSARQDFEPENIRKGEANLDHANGSAAVLTVPLWPQGWLGLEAVCPLTWLYLHYLLAVCKEEG